MKPDAFAAVMATGIVSIAAADHGYRLVSSVLACVAAILLALLVVWALARLRPSFEDVNVPLQLFTFVAACAVVATRLEFSSTTHTLLGIAAALAWLSLVPLTVRLMWRHRWAGLRDRARGAWELASVATSGLAIVAADAGHPWPAVALLALAICQYCAMTGLVLWRALHSRSAPELRQPDVWILMGGAAIATLAGDHIDKAGLGAIKPVTVVTWVVASAWIPLLAAWSVRLRSGNWWAAVFPLGMYSSATFATSVEMGWPALAVISAVFCWIALAAWLLAISARLRALSAV
ncbi:C4-dicarboxylate ABC transporter [Mycolicibacterium agri]|uniref:C4-dicarboxylate ABC transporter n=1 Tax=Mycolicibacterium agri TaxID=36811 RepID=A0A2A7MY23_MYCAG|nr:tellurite resistance/C4-dicarboxylate transporter family protein [Mycolicibacterium agri]PEG36058.1 C4-dicarboxylate ABC transporter [Mycolicibacterium agri]GFG54306.1 C4-dicarboxylate ABC transporter [Mycolicibacterium agri]